MLPLVISFYMTPGRMCVPTLVHQIKMFDNNLRIYENLNKIEASLYLVIVVWGIGLDFIYSANNNGQCLSNVRSQLTQLCLFWRMAPGLVGLKNRRACKYMYPQTMEVLMCRGLFTKYRRRTNKRRYIMTINSWLMNSSKRSKSGRNIWRKCTKTHNPKAR